MIEQIKLKNNGTKSTTLDLTGAHNCSYRGIDGNACAAGCFIPNELYSIRMENILIDALIVNFPVLSSHMPLGIKGMRLLQAVHDRCKLDVDVRKLLIDWINANVE